MMTTRRQWVQGVLLGGAATAAGALEPRFTLPALPYAYDALEPYIDAQTMQIHHGKHHQAYVDNLNKAVAAEPALAGLSVEELLRRLDSAPAAARAAVRNHGGGHYNHSLFWSVLGPAAERGKPGGRLATAIARTFGGQGAFEDKLQAAAMGVFGSGWAWLCAGKGGELTLETTANQDSPLSQGRTPLLGVDVWEHAYYLKYQNRRAEYLRAIVQVLQWERIARRYEEITQ